MLKLLSKNSKSLFCLVCICAFHTAALPTKSQSNITSQLSLGGTSGNSLNSVYTQQTGSRMFSGDPSFAGYSIPSPTAAYYSNNGAGIQYQQIGNGGYQAPMGYGQNYGYGNSYQQTAPSYGQQQNYYAETSNQGDMNNMLQRNSQMGDDPLPYRSSPRMVSQGRVSSLDNNSYYGNSYTTNGTKAIPKGMSPDLANVLAAGEESQKKLQDMQKQYGSGTNWFNRYMKLPSRRFEGGSETNL